MVKKNTSLDDMFNELTFTVIYNRLKNLALNMFEWQDLPEGMQPEFIESLLYTGGKAIFFNDSKLGLLCLSALPSGGLNVYGVHQEYYANGFNYNVKYKAEECVIIKNNMLMTNTHDAIMLYTNKLAEIERTLDINVKGQKTPYIVLCDDKDLLTFKNLYKKLDGNTPIIYADKNLNLDAIQVFPTIAPFICDKLADYKHDVMNEVLTFLGIDNANTDKRERLISNEVQANEGEVDLNAAYMLLTRERACEEINAMFDINMSVKLREVQQPNEPIYDGTQGVTE
jgi:hypothetical protein